MILAACVKHLSTLLINLMLMGVVLGSAAQASSRVSQGQEIVWTPHTWAWAQTTPPHSSPHSGILYEVFAPQPNYLFVSHMEVRCGKNPLLIRTTHRMVWDTRNGKHRSEVVRDGWHAAEGHTDRLWSKVVCGNKMPMVARDVLATHVVRYQRFVQTKRIFLD